MSKKAETDWDFAVFVCVIALIVALVIIGDLAWKVAQLYAPNKPCVQVEQR